MPPARLPNTINAMMIIFSSDVCGGLFGPRKILKKNWGAVIAHIDSYIKYHVGPNIRVALF